ncbi:MAG TPA: histidinol-phosphatase HisJ family protein [Phycisphaerae bacterium]|nr:histidinol-phosphatase HisJ family protein [Phycisphaerae bacterium]HOJ72833.1 histidinol-phosphatase HisJ family protein [Phycisphaerae bacterium]HOM51740.1 histidinol-phosphatase HisJ family protein [Phycisphaerae bacterium]HON64990.1 histidinol-phosphatase HisJ family protein [Phycisphaerae bacterium]HOQ87483.1 histidinol-phosphatase HisJ family protein [Phycisphaerae bacterium]
MALYDQHMHTWFSTDSQTDPADNVRQAIDLGLAGITFTDHLDTHPIEWPECRYNYEGLAKAVSDLRQRFGDRISIGLGIEVCYQPEQMDRILPFLDEHAFDLVILSVHWTQNRALHLPEHWTDWDIATITQAYLGTVLEAVHFVRDLAGQGRRPFDVLGHLDMVKRYTQRYRGGYDITGYADRIDEILRTCLDAGLVPEVNTSTLRQGLTETMPAGWIVRRYAELGGEAMSLGSDAHSPEHIAAGFETAASMLKENGIKQLAVFEQRVCKPCGL